MDKKYKYLKPDQQDDVPIFTEEIPEQMFVHPEGTEWDVLRAEIQTENVSTPNTNLEGINVDELTESDLRIWQKARDYKETGVGFTVKDFETYRASIEGSKNQSSHKLQAYLFDYLPKRIFYSGLLDK